MGIVIASSDNGTFLALSVKMQLTLSTIHCKVFGWIVFPLNKLTFQHPLVFQRKSLRQVSGEEKGRVSSRSVGSDTATSYPVETGQPPDEFHLSPSKQCWIKEGSSHYGGFPGFGSSDGVLRELDDGQFDQEDGVTQVTCM